MYAMTIIELQAMQNCKTGTHLAMSVLDPIASTAQLLKHKQLLQQARLAASRHQGLKTAWLQNSAAATDVSEAAYAFDVSSSKQC